MRAQVSPLTSWAKTFLGPETVAFLRDKPVQVIGDSPRGPWSVRVSGPQTTTRNPDGSYTVTGVRFHRTDVPSGSLLKAIADGLAELEGDTDAD